MQYCANYIERVAIYPIEQTVRTNKQNHNAQANELCLRISGERSDSPLFTHATTYQVTRLSWVRFLTRVYTDGVGRSGRDLL
jgi:hypothetical protein